MRQILFLPLLLILIILQMFPFIAVTSIPQDQLLSEPSFQTKKRSYLPTIKMGKANVSVLPPLAISNNQLTKDFSFSTSVPVFDVLPFGDQVFFSVLRNNSLFVLDVRNGEVNSFTFPKEITPFKLKASSDGTIWFTDYTYRYNDTSNYLVQFFPENLTYYSYEILGGSVAPFDLYIEQERVWFSMWLGNGLGYLNLHSKNLTEIDILCSETCGPLGMTIDPEGNLWFVESYTNLIVRYNPTTESIIKYPIDPDFIAPVGVTIDQNGHFWTGSHGGDLIVSFDPNTGSVSKKFYVPKPDQTEVALAGINDLHIDQNQRIWAVEHFKDSVVVVNQTSETLIEYRTERKDPTTQFGKVNGTEFWFAQFAYGIISVVPEEKQLDIDIKVAENQIEVRKGGTAKVELSISYKRGPLPELNLKPFADALKSDLIKIKDDNNEISVKLGQTKTMALEIDISRNTKISVYKAIIGFSNTNLRVFGNIELVVTENFVQTFLVNNIGGYIVFAILVIYKKKPWKG